MVGGGALIRWLVDALDGVDPVVRLVMVVVIVGGVGALLYYGYRKNKGKESSG